MTIPYAAAKDTLAYQLGTRPLTRMIDFSDIPIKKVMPEFKTPLHPEVAKPEREALWFYLLNHAVARIRELKAPNEPLGEFMWVLEKYHEECALRAVRAYRYLMLIVTREARHGTGQLSSEQYAALAKKYTSAATDFVLHKIVGASGSEEGAAGNLRKNPPDCTVGQYLAVILALFNEGGWSKGSTSYGGKKWGNVTQCLIEYVHGRYSAEMMLDTVWTLCHNGGPIFNKGMQYEMYNGPTLSMILDVQRSGQIPQMIVEGLAGGYADPALKDLTDKLVKAIPGMMDPKKPYVDWFLVEALGSVKKWPNEKAKQTAKYGAPPEHAEMVAKANAAAEAKAKAAAAAKIAAEQAEALKHANSWEMMPGTWIEKAPSPRAEKAEAA